MSFPFSSNSVLGSDGAKGGDAVDKDLGNNLKQNKPLT
jgi:hypothetical protein